tara:strand:+ start:73 stop:477 length:405 start_codon:yes stop_codon:yes gene_type:complete
MSGKVSELADKELTETEVGEKEPGERESFDNFLDYKDELEEDFSIGLNTKNRKLIYTAVINELRHRNLVNKAFYDNQIETISFLEDETDGFKDIMYLFLNIWIMIFLYGTVGIVVLGEYKKLAQNSFNTTIHEL